MPSRAHPRLLTTPWPRPSPGRRRAPRGFSLIELLVTMAVLVLVLGIAISSLSGLSSTQLRTQANRLAAALRHTYSRAVAHGLYMRLVIDLDTESYWVEASDQPIFLPSTKRSDGSDPSQETEEEQKKKERRQSRLDKDAPPRFEVKRAAFQKDGLIPTIKFEKGIEIDSALSQSQTDFLFNGKVYVHFFPNGLAEAAIIRITDGKETFTSLVVEPMTGKVTRLAGRAEPDRWFGVPDKTEAER